MSKSSSASFVTPVILCGGSGSRLWPLSRSGFPKQFLVLTDDDSNQSLFQQAVTRINAIGNTQIKIGPSIVVTNEEPNDTIINKLKYLFDHSGIFIVIHYIKRLQFNVLKHELVPKATILSEEEAEGLKTKFHIKTLHQLPEISRFDPQALSLCLRPGQVIMLERKSNTAMTYEYYRICI